MGPIVWLPLVDVYSSVFPDWKICIYKRLELEETLNFYKKCPSFVHRDGDYLKWIL